MKNLRFSAIILLLIVSGYCQAQLLVSSSLTPTQWVQDVLVGQGVTTSNITYNGAPLAAGTFVSNSNIGLNSGVLLTSGDINIAPGPNNSTSATASNNWPNIDPDLQAIATGTVQNCCVLAFDFIPQSDTIRFRYVFASEEYPEFVGTSFNDVFGFFVSGPGITGPFTNNAVNIALIPNTSTAVAINNVNQNINTQYYISNTGGLTVQYDGFTTVLTAWHAVIPCQTYHIKLAIADVSDQAYDSGVFLEENSFTSTSLNVNTVYSSPGNPFMTAPIAIEGCRNAAVKFTLPFAKADTQYVKIHNIMTGTAIWNTDFTLGNYNPIDSTVMILPFHVAGNLSIVPAYDGIPEGVETVEVKIRTSICTLTDTTIIIPIYDYVNITMTASNDTAVCESAVQLNINPTGGAPPYGIQWSPIQTLSNPHSVNPLATMNQNTVYTVVVKDSTRCSVATDSVHVTYNLNPMISFKPEIYEGCDSLVVQFTNITTPNTISNWYWTFGDGTSDTAKNPLHTFHYDPNIPAYTVYIAATTPEGCSKNYTVDNLIKVFPLPTADFTATPDSVSIDESLITFTNLSSANCTNFLWSFSDSIEGNSNEPSPSYTFTETGTFNVWLWVMSDKGCKDSISKPVTITPMEQLTIPNIITPNGDGKNDNFVITNLQYLPKNSLIVYNRWGKKVYEASPYLNDWNGKDFPNGTYYYLLRTGKRSGEYKYDGTLTILR